jgi:hypothetical protein
MNLYSSGVWCLVFSFWCLVCRWPPIDEPDQGIAGFSALIGLERMAVLIFENPAKYIRRALAGHQMDRQPNV